MNPNERIAQLEETIRLKDQEIYDVKTSVAGVLEILKNWIKNQVQVWKFMQCFWVSLLHIH